MCLCWIHDDDDLTEFTKMDISCLGIPFARFPDVSVNHVAQLDIVNSGLQVLDNDALVSSAGVEALGLMGNRLASIGEKSLVGIAGSLRSLDLSYNALEEIPFKALRGLRKLNWLNMHSNHITSLDGDWGQVTETLTNGFFGENSIIEIPQVLSHFNKLVWLNLDGNNIQNIQDFVLPLNIRTLSLNNNLLTSFPVAIKNLELLNWLYLRGNSIKILEIPNLKSPSLELIDISDNIIESIRFLTSSNSTLYIKDLNMSNNKITTISADVFKYLSTRRIHLSSNNISFIDINAFNGLEDILEYLNLENNELNGIPSALSGLKRISYLNLANNNIHNISYNAFESFGEHLRVLSLATNNLVALPVIALTVCRRLLHLNLEYNKITNVVPGDFEWAESLEILVLRNNALTKLDFATFKGANKLKELSLSFNQLSEFNDKALVGIENNLEIIELSFAFANDALPNKALASLNNLLWLVLDNNNFHTIDSNIFCAFQQLRYINMESNQLNYLSSELFCPDIHQKLRDIKFGYNYLEIIPDDTFVNLTELRSLDLTGNRIHHLTFGTINNCPKLTTISLAYNRISSMENEALHALPNLKYLNLEFNELTSLNFDAITESGELGFSLNVSYNVISEINYVRNLINLTSLDIGYNNLTQLPGHIFTATPNLRTLDLRSNYLTTLQSGTFALEYLETLNLRDNRLEALRKQAFHGMPSLQQLDISGNSLFQISTEQFRNLRNLRILNISRNRIRSLPRDIFEGTRIELLDLSYNKITIVPSPTFLEVAYTLRDLNLAENFIEHLDALAFPTSQLTSLNLANNHLTILPDNSFVSLTKLQSLNLSQNYLQANFKELLHYLPGLRHLYMINCGFRQIPILPLTNLNILDLSFNDIDNIKQVDTQYFPHLKVLKLVNNSLTAVPNVKLQFLRQLDLSYNPIEELTRDTFVVYPRLEDLVLRKLYRVKLVNNDCLQSLHYLKRLRLQTWSQGGGLELHRLLNGLPLRTIEIEVTERVLKNQIHNAFTRRLRELTITGEMLEVIAPAAFSTIESGELILRIKDTHVRRFQSDIFLSLARKMSQLTLDLRNNNINELSPSVIYGNLSWETVGTNLVAGGLQISGNPLECDCEIAWLSLWLRRWLREARQIHTASQSDARQLRNIAGRAVCTETTPSYSSNRVLLTLGTPHTACQASALSRGDYTKQPSKSFWHIHFILIFLMKLMVGYT
ncbi:hypothetical protein PV325_001105 [Microctonus aethiopoides]|nr:hypothetical protein PV325_001105 [Microctonus aethiopoides]